ncbi:MAG: copper chaperone, partial [Bacteroidetes bacterium]
MKYLSFIALLPLLWLGACSEPRKTAFFTEGNCAECKALIEAVLRDTKGVNEAVWDFETSMVDVIYDSLRTDEETIQKALAAAGFATGYFDADTAARKK